MVRYGWPNSCLLPLLSTDDLWRVPFSLSRSHQIQILLRQLCCLRLQSRGHLPVRGRHEPVADRHRQVLHWPAQAALPGRVQARLEVHQLFIGGVH